MHRLPTQDNLEPPGSNSEIRPLEAIRTNPVAWFKFEQRSLFRILEQSFNERSYSVTCMIAERLNTCSESRAQWDDWQRALNTARSAAIAADDKVLQARVLFRAGDALIIQEHFANAQELLRECLQIFDELNMKKECSQTRLGLGYVELQLGHLDEADVLLTSCLNYFESTGDTENCAESRCDLALVYKAKGDFDAARRGLERALCRYPSPDNISWLAFALVNLGDVDLAENEVGRAIERYKDALPLLECLENRLWTAVNLWNIGDTFRENGERRLARRALSNSYKIFVFFDDPRARQVGGLLKRWMWRRIKFRSDQRDEERAWSRLKR